MSAKRYLWTGVLGTGVALLAGAALWLGGGILFKGDAALNLPSDALDAPVVMAFPTRETALPTSSLATLELPDDSAFSAFGEPCGLAVMAEPTGNAIVRLSVSAPCRAGGIVRIGHMGLRFDKTIPSTGHLVIDIPAFASEATFDIVLADGDRAAARVEIDDPMPTRRVALQWQGDGDLSLTARSVGNATPEVTALGDPEIANGWRVAVLTVPAMPSPETNGVVRVAVQAAVTDATCGQDIAAATVEPDFNGVYRLTPVTLSFPGCDRVGDILVLKNLLRDLRIASN